jgi:4-hydroxybenzoate polyprenyltransferase
LRLKRFPFIATGVAALAGMLIFCIGYTALSPVHSLAGLPLSLFFFLLIAYTVSLPLKDFKDIAGDQADNVLTLPVLFGREKARHIMSTAVFLVFIASVFFIHAPEVFPWTLLWSTLAFWTIETTERSPWRILSFRALPAWILLWACCYGAGLVVFLA